VKLAYSRPARDEAQRVELFNAYRENGYEGLQLKGDYLPYLDEPQRFYETYPQMRGGVSGLILGCKLDAEGSAKLQRVFRFAGAIAAPLVVFCHSAPRADVTRDDLLRFAREFSELGKVALACGTRLTIHNHAGQPLMYRDDLAVFFDAIAPGSVGLTLDTAHLAKAGVTDIAGVIRQFSGMIDNYHFKDVAGENFATLGAGTIDFAPVFRAIRETGYDGWVCADEESGAPVVESMQGCHAFIKEGLNASNVAWASRP
jgi:inosose dehydratase